MDYEDSREALFVEPNAYLINYKQVKEQSAKKVVFSEPYESLPNFYIDNNFHKHNCDCVPKPKPKENFNNFLGVDFKSLLPLLSNFLGGNYKNILNIISSMSNGKGDINSLIGNVLSNKETLNSVMSLFNKKQNNNQKKEIPETEFQIKNYKKVEN